MFYNKTCIYISSKLDQCIWFTKINFEIHVNWLTPQILMNGDPIIANNPYVIMPSDAIYNGSGNSLVPSVNGDLLS